MGRNFRNCRARGQRRFSVALDQNSKKVDPDMLCVFWWRRVCPVFRAARVCVYAWLAEWVNAIGGCVLIIGTVHAWCSGIVTCIFNCATRRTARTRVLFLKECTCHTGASHIHQLPLESSLSLFSWDAVAACQMPVEGLNKIPSRFVNKIPFLYE